MSASTVAEGPVIEDTEPYARGRIFGSGGGVPSKRDFNIKGFADHCIMTLAHAAPCHTRADAEFIARSAFFALDKTDPKDFQGVAVQEQHADGSKHFHVAVWCGRYFPPAGIIRQARAANYARRGLRPPTPEVPPDGLGDPPADQETARPDVPWHLNVLFNHVYTKDTPKHKRGEFKARWPVAQMFAYLLDPIKDKVIDSEPLYINCTADTIPLDTAHTESTGASLVEAALALASTAIPRADTILAIAKMVTSSNRWAFQAAMAAYDCFSPSPTMGFVPRGLELGELNAAASWQVFVCAALEHTPVCEGDGFWICGPPGLGKTTILKLLYSRYPGQVSMLTKRASNANYDDTSVINYNGQPLLVINDPQPTRKKSGEEVWPETFLEILRRLTDGFLFDFIWGSRTIRVTPVCKVLVVTTAPLPDIPDLHRRYKQITVTTHGAFEVQQRSQTRTTYSPKKLTPRRGLSPAIEDLRRRFQPDTVDTWLPDPPAESNAAAASLQPPAASPGMDVPPSSHLAQPGLQPAPACDTLQSLTTPKALDTIPPPPGLDAPGHLPGSSPMNKRPSVTVHLLDDPDASPAWPDSQGSLLPASIEHCRPQEQQEQEAGMPPHPFDDADASWRSPGSSVAALLASLEPSPRPDLQDPECADLAGPAGPPGPRTTLLDVSDYSPSSPRSSCASLLADLHLDAAAMSQHFDPWEPLEAPPSPQPCVQSLGRVGHPHSVNLTTVGVVGDDTAEADCPMRVDGHLARQEALSDATTTLPIGPEERSGAASPADVAHGPSLPFFPSWRPAPGSPGADVAFHEDSSTSASGFTGTTLIMGGAVSEDAVTTRLFPPPLSIYTPSALPLSFPEERHPPIPPEVEHPPRQDPSTSGSSNSLEGALERMVRDAHENDRDPEPTTRAPRRYEWISDPPYRRLAGVHFPETPDANPEWVRWIWPPTPSTPVGSPQSTPETGPMGRRRDPPPPSDHLAPGGHAQEVASPIEDPSVHWEALPDGRLVHVASLDFAMAHNPSPLHRRRAGLSTPSSPGSPAEALRQPAQEPATPPPSCPDALDLAAHLEDPDAAPGDAHACDPPLLAPVAKRMVRRRRGRLARVFFIPRED